MKTRKKIWNTIKDDFKNVNLDADLRLDLSEMLDFYLDKEQKKELSEMKWFKKIYILPLWLLKILFFKLSRFRRMLFAISFCLFIMFVFNNTSQDHLFVILSYAIMILILILELKDKLIAADELKAGRIVQQAFNPDQNFNIAGWSGWLYTEPANSVGGDMIDVVKIDANRYGISLGDVSGKELAAALYMVKLQSTLRAVINDFTSLKELGEKINRIFYRDSESNRFATMIYLDIIPDSGNIKILNAGHMPPVIVNNSGFKELPKGGIAFGIKKDAEYVEQKEMIEAGDLIVIYSDGVTEAVDSNNNFFEKKRLIDMVTEMKDSPVNEIGVQVLKKIKNFIGDEKASDDISLIILKRE